MRRNRKKSLKSTLVVCWIYAVLLPMIMLECFTLVQVYRLNYEKIDAAVVSELMDTQKNINQIISNMAAMSQQLASDGNIGKNLYYYFTETDMQKKISLLIYLREQIGTYEAANPTLGNITYFIQVDSQDNPKQKHLHKINQSSLASEVLPEEDKILMKNGEVSYYGPHRTASTITDYPVISLVRHYKMTHGDGKILIYIESGYRTLEKLLPAVVGERKSDLHAEMANIYRMEGIFTILSANGDVVYSSDEAKIAKNQPIQVGNDYRTYQVGEEGQWSLCAMIPESSYYSVLYNAMFSFILILIATVFVTILISMRLWKGVSSSFRNFEQNLKQIGATEEEEWQLKKMNISEFDESIIVFERLRERIKRLVHTVQNQEAEKYSLEVKSLMGKINPHFLNNTLDTLKWYADGRGEREIVSFITDLNKLLFYNMNKSRVTTLESELVAVKSYVALQKWKYEFDFVLEMDTHPQLLKADMPRFLLQPLVENAILHGDIPGKIWIKVFLQKDGRIAVHIFNHGKHIEDDFFERLLQAKEDLSANGIGLQYVIRSLENRYGTRYGFEMGSTEGTEINFVKLAIPFEVAKQEDVIWRK